MRITIGHTFGVRVLKMDRPDGRRVLKFDGAFGPEGYGRLTAAGCVEGL